MRTFTLDEANMLLPVVEPLLRIAIESNRKLQELEQEFQQVNHHVFLSGGSLLNISAMLALKKQREAAAQKLRGVLAEIDTMGVQVKDLELGLLDFPCTVEGEIVLLCWKLGEPTIGYWHTVEEGFKGRKPIDARIPGTKQKPI